MSSHLLIPQAIRDGLVSPNETDRNLEAANVVDGLFEIARALDRVARSIHALGNADAATPMGAIEALGKEVKDGFDRLSSSVDGLSASVDMFEGKG